MPRARPRRTIALILLAVAVLAAVGRASHGLLTGGHGHDTARTAERRVIGLSWLTRFDELVAAGQSDAACRSALALLMTTPGSPEIAPELRTALLSRLSHLLPGLGAPLNTTVAALLSAEPLTPADRKAALAGMTHITDARTRAKLARHLLTPDLASTDLVSALHDADPRIRAAAAAALGHAARHGDEAARQALAALRDSEPDPRVRAAMDAAAGDQPLFAEDRGRTVPLPPATDRVREQHLQTTWDIDPQRSQDGYRCQSQVSIDSDGHAFVDTIRTEGDDRWHVTYHGWAWKDAAGNVIIDARGQPVDHLESPGGGTWSPDSLQIAPNGTTTTIDDRWQRENGDSAFPGSG